MTHILAAYAGVWVETEVASACSVMSQPESNRYVRGRRGKPAGDRMAVLVPKQQLSHILLGCTFTWSDSNTGKSEGKIKVQVYTYCGQKQFFRTATANPVISSGKAGIELLRQSSHNTAMTFYGPVTTFISELARFSGTSAQVPRVFPRTRKQT